MVQFIKQEANEKAREIAIATEEEFNIEKLSMVDGEKIKIAKEYERKEMTVDTAKKIEASTGRNAMRLKVLAAREQAMESPQARLWARALLWSPRALLWAPRVRPPQPVLEPQPTQVACVQVDGQP